uniref:Uncharacterized protein n=1 Tax=Vespula pensylvanica TaxID=30213 RepID=A0A834PF27_VESPE|nr:hypothetical protein H0235_001034 [Vespula pensylvanica]
MCLSKTCGTIAVLVGFLEGSICVDSFVEAYIEILICTNGTICPFVAGLNCAVNFEVIPFVFKNVNNSCERKFIPLSITIILGMPDILKITLHFSNVVFPVVFFTIQISGHFENESTNAKK